MRPRLLCLRIPLALIVLSGCDGRTRVSGKVLDENGNALSGSAVSLTIADEEHGSRESRVVTDENGEYDISLTHAPNGFGILLDVNHDGYKNYQQELNSGSKLVDNRITLERELGN